MYGKIFESIYDGTLAEDWRALITFQQFIVLSDADGMVDMTPQSISRRTGIPIEHIKAGVEVLEKTDKFSRTPDQEGRRIELIDPHRPWGWHIVNHEKYKLIRSNEDRKAYMKRYMADYRKQNCLQEFTDVNSKQPLAPLADKDTDIDTNKKKKTIGQKNNFDLFWSSYPRKVKKKESLEVWKRKKLDSKSEELISDIKNRLQKDDSWKNGFIPHPTTYLRGERWNDDVEVKTQDIPMNSKSEIIRIGCQKGLKPRPGESHEDYATRIRTTRGN